jgi:predicted transcriptional regulator
MFTIFDIMFAYVIMHNMVIGDEGLNNIQGFEHVTTIQMCKELSFNSYMEFIEKLENQNKLLSLRSYFIEHLWVLKGSNFA